ncbi:adenosylcobinamide-GDP ribazoletransferase [Rhodobacteraceae bacterium B1Z28]|uniref:Adenosylcobinamide-GDP ribazoletransferase n=1 Tax=Ruegeria haliotis TaxID=2747601 RepID=A0ABX2PLA9_9RHOB|nr:adenosylcobinamide-GDP ribazoletransferase [Ruegeria haliotis]NVO54900.1 adenosylcobinamide-GDP ribazoletransferase [Ruegeria haliotis]
MLKNDTKPFSLWDVPLALVLLTRLPLPRLPEAIFTRQARAAWAFPVVGLIVGGLGCLTGWMAMGASLSPFVAATLLVAVLIITTGAMHEDGLADTFDGLWGGFTRERRLEIMKDSHIGTYGVLGLLISQLLRISAVTAVMANGAFWAVLAACVFSRAVMPILMVSLPNARNAGLSHSVGVPNAGSVGVSLGLAVLIVLLLGGTQTIIPILCAAIVVGALAIIAKAKIGGQTGDILGASQQLAEIAFLLAVTSQF